MDNVTACLSPCYLVVMVKPSSDSILMKNGSSS